MTMPLAPVLVTLAYVTSAGFDAGVYAQTMVRPMIIGLIAAIIITTVAVVLTRSKDAGGAAALVALLLTCALSRTGRVPQPARHTAHRSRHRREPHGNGHHHVGSWFWF